MVLNLFNSQIELVSTHPDDHSSPVMLSRIQSVHQHDITPLSQSKQAKISHLYRPDIDGLRTIAIISVIIYHAWPRHLPGGFIGVDVFFVISGYLISQIIIKQAQKNSFSFLNFYSRRVKRIFPPLITILLFTLYIIARYSEKDQAQLGFNSLDASVIFGANIQVLLHNKGYFDPDIRINPLLHLWSLGVEQQFYILWPCLLILIFKNFQKRALVIMGSYAGLTFLISIIATYTDTKFAFYFPICRFWQMTVGGILAYLKININNSKINNSLSILSLFAILLTCFIINDRSIFPGFWALIPTFSSACIIQAKGQAFVNKYILSSKLFVFIGKISYSLYLWHWPLLVFSRSFYPVGSTSMISNTFFIILSTIILSVLTHYIIQNPIRKMKGNKIVFVLISIMLMIGFISLIVNYKILPQLEKYNQEYIKNYSIQAQQQMKPRQQDYIEINGIKHPNLSRSRNRKSTTPWRIKASKTDQVRDYSNGGKQLILQKNIDQNSIYNLKNKPFLNYYAVANEGKSNMLLIIGDSHSLKLSYRFQQLHKQSIQKNNSQNFPTVTMSRFGQDISGDYHLQMMDYSIQFIKQFKTKRVLLVNHWINRWCIQFEDDSITCDLQKLEDHSKILVNYIIKLRTLGVQVSSNAPDIQSQKLDPFTMMDANGVIEQNIKPFKLSSFKNKFKNVIEQFTQTLKSVNVQIIDFTDNLCWNDNCEVLTPSGHGVYIDRNHYGKFYTRHWMSVVDHLVQF